MLDHAAHWTILLNSTQYTLYHDMVLCAEFPKREICVQEIGSSVLSRVKPLTYKNNYTCHFQAWFLWEVMTIIATWYFFLGRVMFDDCTFLSMTMLSIWIIHGEAKVFHAVTVVNKSRAQCQNNVTVAWFPCEAAISSLNYCAMSQFASHAGVTVDVART